MYAGNHFQQTRSWPSRMGDSEQGTTDILLEWVKRHSQQHVMGDTSENLNMQHNGKAINKSSC